MLIIYGQIVNKIRNIHNLNLKRGKVYPFVKRKLIKEYIEKNENGGLIRLLSKLILYEKITVIIFVIMFVIFIISNI